MNAAENAFNALYPPVLRVVALHRRLSQLANEGTITLDQDEGREIVRELDELTRQVDAIEAGLVDDSLQTSIAGVLNMLRLQGAPHKN